MRVSKFTITFLASNLSKANYIAFRVYVLSVLVFPRDQKHDLVMLVPSTVLIII